MNKKVCKKVYFFDLDDTLVETTHFNKAAVKHSLKVLDEFNINISQSDAWNFYESIYQDIKASSNMMELYYEDLFKKYPEYINEDVLPWRVSAVGICKYEEFFEKNIKEYIPEGVIDSLEKLCTMGCEVGIISQGKPEFQAIKFKNMGLEKYFNSELKYYFLKKNKKNYEEVKEDMEEMFPGYELIMVGDREDVDIFMPEKVGFTPIRIVGTGKYHKKTSDNYLEFENFKEFFKSLR